MMSLEESAAVQALSTYASASLAMACLVAEGWTHDDEQDVASYMRRADAAIKDASILIVRRNGL